MSQCPRVTSIRSLPSPHLHLFSSFWRLTAVRPCEIVEVSTSLCPHAGYPDLFLTMSYHPIGNPKGSNAQVNDIELSTRYEAGAFNYAPPSGPPPDHDAKHVDTKDAFRTNEPPVGSWPVHSQRVATVTSLRALLMVFDAVLASTPIMFVGKSCQSELQDWVLFTYSTHWLQLHCEVF